MLRGMEGYSSAYFDALTGSALSSARQIMPVVLRLTGARSVVDVGCATGAWLSVVREEGVEDVLGLDGAYVDRSKLLIPSELFVAHDLERPIRLGRRFDLVLSLETAEHLSPSAAAAFVASLVELAPVVLFSAAIPNQGGVNHVNERWPEYWAWLFSAHGYQQLDVIRSAVWDDPEVDYPYAQNTFLYVRQGVELADATAATPMPMRVVHPEALREKAEYIEHQWAKLRLRRLPRTFAEALGEAIARRARSLLARGDRDAPRI
jgi:SAM-dependent methyltransferase